MSAALLFKQAFQAHQAGDLAAARQAYSAVLKQQPTHFDALHMRGVLALQESDFQTAAELIERAVAQHAGYALAWQNLATAYKSLGRTADAANSLAKKLSLSGPDVPTLDTLAELQLSAGRPAQAAQTWSQLLTLDENHVDALTGLGIAQRELGHSTQALFCFNRALELAPHHARAACNRGISLCLMQRYAEALVQLDAVLSHHPDYPAAHNARALVLWRIGRLDEARGAYDQAIALAPDYAEALCNRGALFTQRGDADPALRDFQQALALEPQRAQTHDCLGSLLRTQHRAEEAIHSYTRAVTLQPKNAQLIGNLASALADAGRAQEALPHFAQVIELSQAQSQQQAAGGAATETLANAFFNRSAAWAKLGRFTEASVDARQALALNPGLPYATGNALYFELMQCHWIDHDKHVAELQNQLSAGQAAATPFVALAVGVSPALQRACATDYAARQFAVRQATTVPQPALPAMRQSIRVAFVSADLHDHATAHLITGVIERMDRQRIESIAISYGPLTTDVYQQRLRAACTHFVDVRQISDAKVCETMREKGVHIAVDLKGFTHGARPGIFSQRCAPIQVGYLGYPGASGMPCIDYILADAVALPREMEPCFSEQVVRLPHSYQCNDAAREVSPNLSTRTALGLPPDGFVFCCFNNNYKITPEVFNIWMRLLQQLPRSVMWLLQDNLAAADNLKREALARGVVPERLVFAQRLPTAEHLARQRLADLFLDTWPVNAHTTASDALWVGLPLITKLGDAFAGRVAASLLSAIGRTDCIAADAAQYEALALALARDPPRLAALRQALAQARERTPLFNTALSARHLETAFTKMVDRWRAGLPPVSFDVPP